MEKGIIFCEILIWGFEYATKQIHIQPRPLLMTFAKEQCYRYRKGVNKFISAYCQENCKDIARQFLDWMKRGIPELGDCVGMVIGATTDRVIHHRSFLEDPMAIRYMNKPKA